MMTDKAESRPIRTSAKAVVVQDGQVLLIRNADESGEYYGFPGGGQGHGESLSDAVVRECLEETGLPVTPGDLLHVREYIGSNYPFGHDAIHQVEFYFACRAETDGPEPVMNGEQPDAGQLSVEWVPLERLAEIRLIPAQLGDKLAQGKTLPCYLGDTL